MLHSSKNRQITHNDVMLLKIDITEDSRRTRLLHSNYASTKMRVVLKAGMPESRNAGMPEIKTRKS